MIKPMCPITTPAQPKMNEVIEKTYKLKTVDQTKDNTINICNLTALGKLLRSFLESSNIIFALSIIKAFNLSIIFDLYLL